MKVINLMTDITNFVIAVTKLVKALSELLKVILLTFTWILYHTQAVASNGEINIIKLLIYY